jgi:tRNA 2-selenouridine synthase
MADFIRQVLLYYDKTYRKDLITRDPNHIVTIVAPDANAKANADHLLSIAQKIGQVPIISVNE